MNHLAVMESPASRSGSSVKMDENSLRSTSPLPSSSRRAHICSKLCSNSDAEMRTSASGEHSQLRQVAQSRFAPAVRSDSTMLRRSSSLDRPPCPSVLYICQEPHVL